MPEVGTGARLLGYLYEIGPTAPGGMGPAAISNQEIAAWCGLSGVRLTPWEAKTLRALSREYIAEQHAAADPARPAPWAPEEGDESAAAAVSLDMRADIAAMAAPVKAAVARKA